MTAKRIYWAQDALDAPEERGYDVGRLKRKAPREFRRVTWDQSGFDVDRNTGRNDHATLWLSKIGPSTSNTTARFPTMRRSSKSFSRKGNRGSGS